MQIEGQGESAIVKWENKCDDTILRTYADMQYTTEHGAVCLALMLTITYTPYTIIERSRKGTGFDYFWLKGCLAFPEKSATGSFRHSPRRR